MSRRILDRLPSPWTGLAVIALSLTTVIWLTTLAAVTDPASTSVAAPNIVAVSGTPANAFASNSSDTAGRQLTRFIQNTGTVPVLYALGSTVATTNYHGVLAACTATRDGLGSVVNLSSWRGTVSVMCESGSGTVVTVEIVK